MKLKRVLGIATIVLLVICAASTQVKSTVMDVDDADYQIESNVGQIEENMIVEYCYKASGETVDGYQVHFATYGESINKGRIYLEIYDADTNEMIGSGAVDADEIYDNEPTFIGTDKVNLGKKNIRLVIYSQGFEKDKQVTMWMGTTEKTEDGKTLVNGLGQKSNLLIFERRITSEAPYTCDCILITSVCFVLFCCVPGKNKEEQPGGSDELEEETAQA